MPINATIPLGVQPLQVQQQDPNAGMNALARMMQIRGLQDEQKMNALNLQEKQRSIEDQNALRSALSAPGADPYNVLLQRGKVKEAIDFQKGNADVAKTKAETEFKAIETAHKKVDLIGQTLGWVRQNPTLENATAAMQYLARNGAMTPEDVQDKLARFQADPTPQSIASFADMGFRAALQVKDQLPKYDTRNLGGSTQMTAVDPVTGQVRVVNSVQNTQSPDNAATNARTAADNAAARAVTMRGQNMTDARSREQIAQGAVEYKQQADGSWIALPKKAAAGPVQSQPVMGPGGQPMPTKNEVSARNALGIISEAEKVLDDATGSYIGAGADLAAQAVGKSTKGAIATAKLKALEGALMLAQPRMEGPQSDKDVALYRQMAAQLGDPTVPRAQKKAALDTVKALHQRYAPQQVQNTGGATGDFGGSPAQPRVIDFGSLR